MSLISIVSFHTQRVSRTGVNMAGCLLAIFVGTQAAATLPPTSLQTVISYYSRSTEVSGELVKSGDGSSNLSERYNLDPTYLTAPFGQAFASVYSAPRLSASASGNRVGSIFVRATLNYHFTPYIASDDDGGLIPIKFIARLTATNSGAPDYSDTDAAIARSFLGVFGTTSAAYEALSCPNRCALDSSLTQYNFLSGVGTASLFVEGSILAWANSDVSVYETIATDAIGTGNASAFADPYFFIDPVFLAAHPGYSLVFSQFVGNSLPSDVPEPATWAMIITGFSLVGTLSRSRAKNAAR